MVLDGIWTHVAGVVTPDEFRLYVDGGLDTGVRLAIGSHRLPPDTGSVSLSPAGGTYDEGTVVTLTAAADAGSILVGWSGDLTGSISSATVTMNANKAVTAAFDETPSTPPPGDRPIAHWALDETSGTVAEDSSGNGYDGTLESGPGWTTGVIGGGGEMDRQLPANNQRFTDVLDDVRLAVVRQTIRTRIVQRFRAASANCVK